MRSILSLLLSLSVALPVMAEESAAEKGLRIAKENDAFNSGYQGISNVMTMTLINAHGDKIERKMSNKSKETPKDGDKSIVEFEWPADVKGTRMLTWTHKEGDDDQWLYLPAIKRVKRISARNRSGSFMGSEFAYEDLGSDEIEKYNFKWLRDEKIDGRDCHVIERIPTDKRSGYSKQIVWIDKEYRLPQKIEYYDRKGELLKVGTFSDYVKIKKWWFANQIKMVNKQTGKSSIINWTERKVGENFSDSLFTQSRLKN